MKRNLTLCLVSAALGAAIAVLWTAPPDAESTTAAGELPSGGQIAAGRGSAAAEPSDETAAWRILPTPTAAEGTDLTAEERVNVAVYENTNRSVVHITTRSVRVGGFFRTQVPSEGEGSGVVIDRQGHVLTNHHVVDGAREIQVALYDGKRYDAQPVGGDEISDVAVLKIDAPAETLHPVTFGNSSGLRVGQRVFAIGNPFGLDRTLTTGIVSSLNRSLPSRTRFRTMEQIIQTDASINPGSSGGPLLDSGGRMIGMNTAIFNKTGADVGVGFAIPINTIARVVPQLIESGRVIRPDVGITQAYQTDKGLLVGTLTPGGAAEKAGLREATIVRRQERRGRGVYEHQAVRADLITAVDGRPTPTIEQFLAIVESKQPGDRITLTLLRDGKQIDLPVTLEAGE